MTNIMKYKKYVATVELNVEAGLLHGEIINLSDVVTFQGRSMNCDKPSKSRLRTSGWYCCLPPTAKTEAEMEW